MGNISGIPTELWNKVSVTLSSDNISKGWKITRDVSLGVYMVTSFLAGPASPIVLGALAVKWMGLISVVSGVVAGVAQTDTSKKK